MGFRINTNVQSLAARNSLRLVKERQDKSLERLSSGKRIITASDDAAGLAISENMRADMRSTRQAIRNAGDGISLVQVAEGGLQETSTILARLKELSVQAASDTVGDVERRFTDIEFQHLKDEIQRISKITEFNGRKLINGEGGRVEFQIGIHNQDRIDRIGYNPEESMATIEHLGIEEMSVNNKENAQTNLESLNNAIDKINASRANLGALQNRMRVAITNMDTKVLNLSAAKSRIADTDVAEQASELTQSGILVNAGTSVLSQANTTPQLALKLIA